MNLTDTHNKPSNCSLARMAEKTLLVGKWVNTDARHIIIEACEELMKENNEIGFMLEIRDTTTPNTYEVRTSEGNRLKIKVCVV